MPQFAATIKHITEGVKSITMSAAIKNIEGWETKLQGVNLPEAKAIVKDLESLKKHLQADALDGNAIRKLVTKLGKETVAIAKKADADKADKIQSLGEALTQAAEQTEEAKA